VLIIDEADLLRHDKRVLETIKSIHDQCDVVTVLTGTGEIEQTLRSYPQFCSRVHQAVEFEDISGTELPSIITQLSEVALAEDAMEELSKHIKTMRDIVRYLPQIERAVKGKNIKKVDRALVRAAAARIPNTRLVA
jgi:DNA transposition AAA+ family ATPase